MLIDRLLVQKAIIKNLTHTVVSRTMKLPCMDVSSSAVYTVAGALTCTRTRHIFNIFQILASPKKGEIKKMYGNQSK